MIIRNSVTLTFGTFEEAARRADFFQHEGNYENVLVFRVSGGESEGSTMVRAVHLTRREG